MDKPEIAEVSVTFTQEGNTLGTTSEYEEINIKLQFQASADEGPFVVLKTEGWSIDNISELNDLIEQTKKILAKPSKKEKNS